MSKPRLRALDANDYLLIRGDMRARFRLHWIDVHRMGRAKALAYGLAKAFRELERDEAELARRRG